MSILHKIKYFKNRHHNQQVRELKKVYAPEKRYNQDGVEFTAKHVVLSNKYAKSYYLENPAKNIGYQNVVDMFNLNHGAYDLDFDYTIKLVSRYYDSVLLHNQAQTTRNNILSHARVPFIGGNHARANVEIASIATVEEKIANGDQLISLVFVITIFTSTESKLKEIDKILHTKFTLAKWNFFSPYSDQKEAFDTSLPLPSQGGYEIKMIASEVSRLFLPTSTKASGVLPLGLDLSRKNIYFYDPFEDDRMHGATITGMNGSGKSAYAKKMFEEYGLLGMQRFYVDSEGECEKLGIATMSEIITVNALSGGANIVYFNESLQELLNFEDYKKENVLQTHINWLISVLLKFKCWDVSILDDRTDLNELMIGYYKATKKKDSDFNYDISKIRNMRTLCDYIQANDKTKDQLIWRAFKNFSVEFGGLYSSYFSTETEFNLDSDSIIFDISGNEDPELRQIFGYIILYKTFQKVLTADRPRVIFIDELHMFLSLKGFPELLTQYLKRCRKYNGSYQLITQELDELEVAPSILKEMSYHFVFKQLDIKTNLIKLREEQKNTIAGLDTGTCLILDNRKRTTDLVKIMLKDNQKEYSRRKHELNSNIDFMNRYSNEN
jgi:AAA-like domain